MRKNFVVMVVGLLMGACGAQAQATLTEKEISGFEEAAGDLKADRAVMTAIANVAIDELTRTSDAGRDVTDRFSIETPKQTIHNQQQSGRCWMFSGLNVLRADFARAWGDTVTVEFSQDYLFFYDQLEKANLMLQTVIDKAGEDLESHEVQLLMRHPIGDGGTFCGVADLTAKYGLVPMEAQPETYSAENTGRLTRLVSSKLREFGLELRRMLNEEGATKGEAERRKMEMMGTIYKMLCYGLGAPTKEFRYTFRSKTGAVVIAERTYTPKEFYDATVGRPLKGTYVMLMNDPRREYHKTYEVEYDRHTYEGQNWKYLNLPAAELAQIAIAQLKDGRKLYSSYDVAKESDRRKGVADVGMYDYGALFGTEFGMNKAERIATFDSGSTHAMTLTAVDLDEEGLPRKWKVENSWGAQSGVNGEMIMTNDWWEEYMFRLVVDKEYVGKELLKEYEQAPTMLAPDDPLAMSDD